MSNNPANDPTTTTTTTSSLVGDELGEISSVTIQNEECRKRKREDDQQDEQDHHATSGNNEYSHIPLCCDRWLASNSPLTISQLRDQVRKRKSYENDVVMRKKLRITGTKGQLLKQLRCYDKEKMMQVKEDIQDLDLYSSLQRLVVCLRHEIDEYYVVPLLRHIRKLLQVYHVDLFAGEIKEEIDINVVGMQLFERACFCDLDFVMSCPQINKILFDENLIAPAVVVRNIKHHERQIAVEEGKMTTVQMQQLDAIDDAVVENDQSIKIYSLFSTAILTRIVRDQSVEYNADKALQRLIQLDQDPLVRASCGLALSEALSRICNCHELIDKLVYFGITDCAAKNFKEDPVSAQSMAEFLDSLNCSHWHQQNVDTLASVMENFVIPAIEGYHYDVLGANITDRLTDQAICVAHRLFSSLRQSYAVEIILDKLSRNYPIMSYTNCQLDVDYENLRGCELGNAIVEHLENWLALPFDDPIRLKHRWLTYSDKIKSELSSEQFIHLCNIPAYRTENDIVNTSNDKEEA